MESIERHPNIIAYHGHFVENRMLCIVMEYAEGCFYHTLYCFCKSFISFVLGGSLAQLLAERDGKLMDESRIVDCFTQIALALNHLHAKRIIHRDIKPQNILLNRARTIFKLSGEGRFYCLQREELLYFVDFGISKCLQMASIATSQIGTSHYMSPEVYARKSMSILKQ